MILTTPAIFFRIQRQFIDRTTCLRSTADKAIIFPRRQRMPSSKIYGRVPCRDNPRKNEKAL